MIKQQLNREIFKITLLATLVLVLLISKSVTGQNAPISEVEVVSTTESTATVAITATGFYEIVGTNLRLLFDPDVAMAVNVTSAIGGNLDHNVQVYQGVGYITLAWYPGNPPQTEPDGTEIFIIDFEKGSHGTTLITWDLDFNDRNWMGYVNGNSQILNDLPLEDYYLPGSLTFGTGVAVNLKVFLEGFYNPNKGEMRKAQSWNPFNDELEDKFEGTIADKITVELHNPNNYGSPVHEFENIELNKNGTANFFIEEAISGEFYITIRHRNHLETVSAEPVDFGQNVLYDFTDSANKAYGNNMHQLQTGVWGLYAGDIDQDGILTGADLVVTNDDVRIGAVGYRSTDVDGDGILTGADMVLINDNIRIGVAKILPAE